jgi:hypothetical protein
MSKNSRRTAPAPDAKFVVPFHQEIRRNFQTEPKEIVVLWETRRKPTHSEPAACRDVARRKPSLTRPDTSPSGVLQYNAANPATVVSNFRATRIKHESNN